MQIPMRRQLCAEDNLPQIRKKKSFLLSPDPQFKKNLVSNAIKSIGSQTVKRVVWVQLIHKWWEMRFWTDIKGRVLGTLMNKFLVFNLFYPYNLEISVK